MLFAYLSTEYFIAEEINKQLGNTISDMQAVTSPMEKDIGKMANRFLDRAYCDEFFETWYHKLVAGERVNLDIAMKMFFEGE